MTLWEVDIYTAGVPDLAAERVAADAADLRVSPRLAVTAASGYLIQGPIDRAGIDRIARELLADPVTERTVIAPVGDPALTEFPCEKGDITGEKGDITDFPGDALKLPPTGRKISDVPLSPGNASQSPPAGRKISDVPFLPDARWLVHVLLKPGVMDPVAQSVMAAVADLGIQAEAVRTLRKYWIAGLSEDKLKLLSTKALANDAIEQVIVGPLGFRRLEVGSAYRFHLARVPLRAMDDAALERLSREGQLYLSLAEMQTLRAHFQKLPRDPTDVELETLAQTWSEHCSHKTLAGRIRYRDGACERRFDNMLRETIFAATAAIRRHLGRADWCVSVFEDNAGVIRFDDRYNVVFKVETHNHPSALEPYGGANTGIGGVIRDPMGTGLGAKPVCNTDVFCFAPPDTPADAVPPGVLHPRRVMKGVVAGVRDYGNRMGIPTVNGAIFFDPRYLGNPLVFCGNVGLIPRGKSRKETKPGDLIVALGGRTGRDGIHGATFSSAELSTHSETISGGAVQIGNAITEKMLLDVLLTARDRGLYHAVTDCGAGGFSSAVGEMGERIGAEVWLDRVPLKYEGLSYTEIWISESQERMVLAVAPEQWDELAALCASEGVEATAIGRFVPTGRLVLKYGNEQVAELAMDFLHEGRPPVVRDAIFTPAEPRPLVVPARPSGDYTPDLLAILGSPNVASKEWVIRQYDHEVQGGSVIKPLVGADNAGPSDAAVIRPVLDSRRGLVIACGMNPRYGDLDPYWMAAAAIDEAVRNCVAVGADPARIAILDNFCWGNTDRPETLGSFVRAALACYDVAIALGTPFISGKDSLNNEFRPHDRPPIAVPPSLLVSALGQVDDVAHCVTMDLKRPGNVLYVVGTTRNELGGSHFTLVDGLAGGQVPTVDTAMAKRTFAAMHRAIHAGLVRACHDPSEGGLAVALAEMAFAGNLGSSVDLRSVPSAPDATDPAVLLFSESNTRFVCEVPPEHTAAFEAMLAGAGEEPGIPHARIGQVVAEPQLRIAAGPATVVAAGLDALREAWQRPLRRL